MKPKYTPGPWQTSEQFNGTHQQTIAIHGPDFQEVCEVNTTMSIGEVQMIANAHLIAAAPELLEALKFCKAALAFYMGQEKEGPKSAETALHKAAMAVAKATTLPPFIQ